MNNNGHTIGIDASNITGGGGLTHLVNLLENVNPDNHNFTKIVVWANQTIAAKLPKSNFIETITPPALESTWLSRRFWQSFKLSQELLAAKCDILFTPGGSAVRGVRPTVTMSQNMLPFEWRQLWHYGWSWMSLRLLLLRLAQAATMRRANGVIFLTDYAKEVISKVTRVETKRSQVIPHGMRADFFQPAKLQHPIGSYSFDNPYRLLYVSIVDTYKHQIKVLEAVATLHAKGLPLTITFVGDSYGPSLDKFTKAMQQLDPEQRFAFYQGPVAHEKLVKFYQEADLGVFASSCENLPIILLEMMAASLPVVCSNMGPMPQVLQDGGIYFNPYDSKNLERAILASIESPEQRWQMALANRRRAVNYSWEKCAANTFSFITECIP